jgi:hypothetical protein
MYGLKYYKNLFGSPQPLVNSGCPDIRVKASQTITKGDPVNIEAGYWNLAAATEKIFGIANETVVGNAGGTSKLEVIPVREGDIFIADNDNVGTTFAATHPGTYFDITGTTGAVLVDTSSTTTTGQLLCVEYNPQNLGLDSDTSIGLFMIAERQNDGLAA